MAENLLFLGLIIPAGRLMDIPNDSQRERERERERERLPEKWYPCPSTHATVGLCISNPICVRKLVRNIFSKGLRKGSRVLLLDAGDFLGEWIHTRMYDLRDCDRARYLGT